MTSNHDYRKSFIRFGWAFLPVNDVWKTLQMQNLEKWVHYSARMGDSKAARTPIYRIFTKPDRPITENLQIFHIDVRICGVQTEWSIYKTGVSNVRSQNLIGSLAIGCRASPTKWAWLRGRWPMCFSFEFISLHLYSHFTPKLWSRLNAWNQEKKCHIIFSSLPHTEYVYIVYDWISKKRPKPCDKIFSGAHSHHTNQI